MKRINSVDGCNQRDHEVGFSIGLGTVETYFGREVYEDKRREYTDDESRMDDRTNLTQRIMSFVLNVRNSSRNTKANTARHTICRLIRN